MLIHTDDRPIAFTMESGSPNQRVEPITLAWAKMQARFPSNAEDLLLQTFIAAARTHFEEQTGRQCLDATWEYALDGPPDQRVIELPRPPLVSVTAVLYVDAAGAEQTLDPSTYRVLPSSSDVPTGSPSDPPVFDPYCPCGRIELAAGASWPTASGLARSLRIRRVCGYGATPDAMPPLLQATIGLLTAHFFRNRQEVTGAPFYSLPLGAQALISAFKWTALPILPPSNSNFSF